MAILIQTTGHGAANVTLGIPRLREIVMTASSKPRTPSMTMLVREDADPADVTKFCQRASRLTLSQLVDRVDVREGLALQGDERNTEYKIDINFYPREEYEAEYDVTLEEIRAAFGRNFSIILKREVIMEMKKLDADLRQQIAQLGKGTKSKEGPERAGGRGEDEDIEDEVADEDGDDGSDDAEDTEAKRARQKTGYESDGETSDDEDQGPYGDEELEQQFADEEKQAPAMKTANVKKPAEKDIPKTMEELFKMNFPAATHIECTDAKCTFGLRVWLRSYLCTKTPAQICPVQCRYSETAASWNCRKGMSESDCARNSWNRRLLQKRGETERRPSCH